MLFVCTGNVCRSPVAERLLAARLGGHTDVRVHSAGTHALVGYGIDGPSALALAEAGGDPTGHVARWLTPQLVADADLILTATTEHRDHVLRMAPRKLRCTFTLREFARLGSDVPGATNHDDYDRVIREVATQRGQVDPAAPGQDDIGDPFGGDVVVARATVATVKDSVDHAARLLGLLTAL